MTRATAYAGKIYIQQEDGKIFACTRLKRSMAAMTHQEIVDLVESVERDPSQLDWVPSKVW